MQNIRTWEDFCSKAKNPNKTKASPSNVLPYMVTVKFLITKKLHVRDFENDIFKESNYIRICIAVITY